MMPLPRPSSRPLLALLLGVAVAVPLAAQAALQSTTLTGVTIGDARYDVIFTRDDDGLTRFDDVFGTGIPTFAFGTAADALAATQAVVGAVTAAGFDLIPGVPSNGFVLPFAADATSFLHFTGWASDPGYGTTTFGPFSRIRASTDYYVAFATFERVAAVAEPSALALLGVGALALAGLCRRR